MSDAQWFPEAKDPDDAAWFTMPFAETLASLVSVVAEPGLLDQGVPVGDFVPVESTNELVIDQGQLNTALTAVVFRARYGVPGKLYPIRATVTTADGSTIANTRALPVAWK